MSKVTKEALKSVIKECLIEILAEGLPLGRNVSQQTKKISSNVSQKKGKSIFDHLDEVKRGTVKPVENFSSSVLRAVKTATDDPILQSMLAETAKTTLQEQMQHEQSIPRVPQIDPATFYSQDNERKISSQRKAITESIFESSQSAESEIQHAPAAGLDISSLFGDVTKNWSEVLDRAEKKLS